jgi:[acyl-carrier-protein] S-malonyltransferase
MAAILGLPATLISEVCSQASDKLTPLPSIAQARNFNTKLAVVSPANLNSPDQTVISGASGAVHLAADLCKQAGAKRTVMLPVSAPFHCALMQPAQDCLAKDLESLAFNDLAIPVAANVDARLVTRAGDSRDCLIRQVTGSVRWVECIQLLAAQGATHFIEVGPGKVLSGLNRQILGKDSAIPTMNVEDTASLEKTLAGLNPN